MSVICDVQDSVTVLHHDVGDGGCVRTSVTVSLVLGVGRGVGRCDVLDAGTGRVCSARTSPCRSVTMMLVPWLTREPVERHVAYDHVED